MEIVENYNEILERIKAIKNQRNGFITNFFHDRYKVQDWIECRLLFKLTINQTFYLLLKKDDFYYLYFCSHSTESLKNSLIELKKVCNNLLLIVDLIGKEPEINSLKKIFSDNYFGTYVILNRMIKTKINEEIIESIENIRFATLEHVQQINELLNQNFDPYAEQLPSINVLIDWVNSEKILIYEFENKIIGFIIFELIGVTSYLRYWFVHPEYRNKKIGSKLFRIYSAESIKTNRHIFWVIQSNENAIKRYRHYGFESENLYDIVMINKKNSNYERKSN